MKRHVLVLVCLMACPPVLATAPQVKSTPMNSQRKADRRIQPCQDQAPQRKIGPQGTLLWGTRRQRPREEMSSVLAWVGLGRVQLGGVALEGVSVEEGRLVAPSLKSGELEGALFQGAASDGQPVEVALCGAERSAEEPATVWYQIEMWNSKKATWENPCVATYGTPKPRALAMRSVWDKSGARHEEPGKFTFACENGAIAKCVSWGYKPWATRENRSLEDFHQACTRMARADYCGNGRSYTQDDTRIDISDELGILTRTADAAVDSRLGQLAFEAAWGPEGAVCLARMRDSRKVETILAECPGRFQVMVMEHGGGDRCTISRKGESTGMSLLRNHLYVKGE